jgi:hypothetical protein
MRRLPLAEAVRGPGTAIRLQVFPRRKHKLAKAVLNPEIMRFFEIFRRALVAKRKSLFADLGVTVIVAAQSRRDQSGCPVSDRAAVDGHDWQDDLAC